ncbi:MAG TPA: CmcI family methyltransferase [Vicinamibacterales bacterium]|jgi:cephalosporin hydroxylase
MKTWMREQVSRRFWTLGWPVIGPFVTRTFFSALVLRTENFTTVRWLGKPILQNTLDLWTIQETIFDLKPALIVETGTNRGGSSYFYAQLFDLMGTGGRIVTIDIARQHDLSHPRITYLIGDSTSPPIVEGVGELARSCGGPILVILDSDHSEAHVARELEAYAGLVTPGSYVLVQDGSIDTLGYFKSSRPGPLPAIDAFLARHPEFAIDRAKCDRFLITHHPNGWLRRN